MRHMLAGPCLFLLSVLLVACGTGGDSTEAGLGGQSSARSGSTTLGLGRSSAQSLDESIADNAREKATVVTAVYRFAKISSGAYFYTGSSVERDLIIANFPDFRYEGPAFGATPEASGKAIYRFAKTDSGGYFFTSDVAERDQIINSGAYPNFRYEGVTFSVTVGGTQGALPVYRLANLRNGSYLLTQSSAERDAAVATGIWRDEGVGFHAYPVGHVLGDTVGPTAEAIEACRKTARENQDALGRTGYHFDILVSGAAGVHSEILRKRADGTPPDEELAVRFDLVDNGRGSAVVEGAFLRSTYTVALSIDGQTNGSVGLTSAVTGTIDDVMLFVSKADNDSPKDIVIGVDPASEQRGRQEVRLSGRVIDLPTVYNVPSRPGVVQAFAPCTAAPLRFIASVSLTAPRGAGSYKDSFSLRPKFLLPEDVVCFSASGQVPGCGKF